MHSHEQDNMTSTARPAFAVGDALLDDQLAIGAGTLDEVAAALRRAATVCKVEAACAALDGEQAADTCEELTETVSRIYDLLATAEDVDATESWCDEPTTALVSYDDIAALRCCLYGCGSMASGAKHARFAAPIFECLAGTYALMAAAISNAPREDLREPKHTATMTNGASQEGTGHADAR